MPIIVTAYHLLFCFLWPPQQSEELFSRCPHIPVYLNMNLSERICFCSCIASTQQQEASTVKPFKVFANASWHPRPCWASANGHEKATVWTFPTWDSVTWRAVGTFCHFLHLRETESGAFCRNHDWKPVWLPALLLSRWTLCYKTEISSICGYHCTQVLFCCFFFKSQTGMHNNTCTVAFKMY